MATTPRQRLERERERVRQRAADGTISTACRDALLEYATALDKGTTRQHFVDVDGRERTYEPRSVERYLQALRLCADRGLELLDCTADEFNAFIDGQHDDRGLSKNTLSGYQAAARLFYQYHSLGVDPADIAIYSHESRPRHDELDMFTAEEVNALREACEKPRDRAFLELLVFTGQRITALRTLRIKDVDVKAGYLYLNEEFDAEHGGLKGALRRGRKRPLFGARKYVRDWLEYHPFGDDPEAWLFVGDPSHWKTDPDDPWSEPGVQQCLRRIAERAGVDKPVNPHNFRHHFVTIMRREYDEVDGDTLRMLLGVVEDSTIFKTTYSHVTNEDFIEKAEAALGFRERERESPMTPEVCPTCGELLESHWRRCPACDEVFAPSLKAVETELNEASDDIIDASLGSEREFDADERRAVRAILDAIDDPLAVADAIRDAGE